MKFCCDGFKNAVENVGNVGISIGAVPGLRDEPMFELVRRFIDEKNIPIFDSAMKEIQLPIPIDIVYVEQSTIGYCPWCGSKLSRKYKRTWKKFEISRI